MKYSEKLKDPRWQRKRLEILQRDDWTCQNCQDSTRTLQVHHREYHGNPWDAPNESLETLCEECHEKRSATNKQFLNLDSRSAEEIGLCMDWSNAQISSLRFIACLASELHTTDSPAIKVRVMRAIMREIEDGNIWVNK